MESEKLDIKEIESDFLLLPTLNVIKPQNADIRDELDSDDSSDKSSVSSDSSKKLVKVDSNKNKLSTFQAASLNVKGLEIKSRSKLRFRK